MVTDGAVFTAFSHAVDRQQNEEREMKARQVISQ